MIENLIDNINKNDIQSLVDAKKSERRTLDYKLQLPGNSDADKREFLYDVSSFANAAGGDLVYGIADEKDATGKATGLPASADGLTLPNPSDAIARLENVVRDGIDPRIQGIQWQRVDGFSNGPVIVMRIPKSLTGPHMVVFGGMGRFYSRNSTGKYPLDVGEIRSAFMESTAIGDRLRAFRRKRVEHIMGLLAPLGQMPIAKTVLHLIPLSILASNN